VNEVKVEWKDLDNCIGLFDNGLCYLDFSLKGRPLKQALTLLHEIFHWFIWKFRLMDGLDDVVDRYFIKGAEVLSL